MFCQAIKFAVKLKGHVVLRDIPVYVSKSAKSQENLPKMVRKKMLKRVKSQEKAREKCKQFRVATLIKVSRANF